MFWALTCGSISTLRHSALQGDLYSLALDDDDGEANESDGWLGNDVLGLADEVADGKDDVGLQSNISWSTINQARCCKGKKKMDAVYNDDDVAATTTLRLVPCEWIESASWWKLKTKHRHLFV
jgi:hypothetical protein